MPVDLLQLAITGEDKSLSQSTRVAAYLKACGREFTSKEEDGTRAAFDHSTGENGSACGKRVPV